MVRGISPRASPAAILASGRRGAAAAAMFLGIVCAAMPLATRSVSAADALTATDWQYLKSIGYEEHSDALDKATKGQRRYLHRLINKPRIGAQLKMNLINSYLMAIGIGTLPK
jgi:hypothetical protein